jgi:hypothetical protein
MLLFIAKFAPIILYNFAFSYSIFNISKFSTVGLTMASMNMDKQMEEQQVYFRENISKFK